MSTTKAVLQELELSNGISLYVQINGNRASISIDHKEVQTCVWLELEELQQFADTINKALEENV